MQQRSEKYQGILIVALVVVASVGAALWYARMPSGEPLVIDNANAGATVETSRTVKVYVTGAVLRPGVYALPDGARVEDAVTAAGGLAVDADRTHINLASVVRDGQQIDVPAFRGSLSAPSDDNGSANAAPSGKININTASVGDLEKLPAIGEVTADKIVSYRESRGPFQRIEDLKDLRLLRSESDFEKIKELISAE